MPGDGSKRERVEDLLGRGLTNTEIAARVPCARSWVVMIRKELGLAEVRQGRGHRQHRGELVEQAIARGLSVEAIARECDVSTDYVVKIRAAMDRAAAEERDHVPLYSARWDPEARS